MTTQPTIQYISINYWAAVNYEFEGIWKEGVVASFAVLAGGTEKNHSTPPSQYSVALSILKPGNSRIRVRYITASINLLGELMKIRIPPHPHTSS
jgi:hypothetical protein